MFGCSKEEDYANATIKIAPIYHAYPQDLNWSSSEIKVIEDTLKQTRTSDNGTIVDNNTFNFLMMVPVSTKDNITKTFKLYGGGYQLPLLMNKCGSNDAMFAIADLRQESIDSNGTYHYFSFGNSNALKARGYFDHITDLCLKLRVSEDTMEKKYLYSSNTVVIPAQEIKDMLDGLGIPYE